MHCISFSYKRSTRTSFHASYLILQRKRKRKHQFGRGGVVVLSHLGRHGSHFTGSIPVIQRMPRRDLHEQSMEHCCKLASWETHLLRVKFILLYISCLYFMIPRLCSRQTTDDAPWLGWKLLRDILNGGCYRTRWEEVGWEKDEYEIIINSSLFITRKKNLIARLEFSLWLQWFYFFLLWSFWSLIFFIWLFDIVIIWAGLCELFCLHINEDVEEIFYYLI